jgi:hypothetical protein
VLLRAVDRSATRHLIGRFVYGSARPKKHTDTLAVGLRPVGTNASALGAQVGQRLAQGVAVPVGEGAVDHDPFDPVNAVLGGPGWRPGAGRRRRSRPSRRGETQCGPRRCGRRWRSRRTRNPPGVRRSARAWFAGAARCRDGGPAILHPRAADPVLHVDVDQLAGLCALVAADRLAGGSVQPRQPRKPGAGTRTRCTVEGLSCRMPTTGPVGQT